MDLSAATHQTPLGSFRVRSQSGRNAPGELSLLAPNACGCGGELLPGGWEPARGNVAGQCPARAAHRAVAAGKGGAPASHPSPLTGLSQNPPGSEAGSRFPRSLLPGAATSSAAFCNPSHLALSHCLWKPNKIHPTGGDFVILIFSLPFAEEGASFAVRASLRRRNQNPAMHQITRSNGTPSSPSPPVSVQLVSLPAPGLPHLLFPCCLPGTWTEKGVCED